MRGAGVRCQGVPSRRIADPVEAKLEGKFVKGGDGAAQVGQLRTSVDIIGSALERVDDAEVGWFADLQLALSS